MDQFKKKMYTDFMAARDEAVDGQLKLQAEIDAVRAIANR